MTPRNILFVALCILIAACGLNDSGVVWRGGPYKLVWIKLPEDVMLCYEGTAIVRVGPRVFAVGWDGRYLVAKQHPNGDRKTTNYFLVEAAKDGPNVDPMDVVTGPLTALEFAKKSAELHLAAFSKELDSLK